MTRVKRFQKLTQLFDLRGEGGSCRVGDGSLPSLSIHSWTSRLVFGTASHVCLRPAVFREHCDCGSSEPLPSSHRFCPQESSSDSLLRKRWDYHGRTRGSKWSVFVGPRRVDHGTVGLFFVTKQNEGGQATTHDLVQHRVMESRGCHRWDCESPSTSSLCHRNSGTALHFPSSRSRFWKPSWRWRSLKDIRCIAGWGGWRFILSCRCCPLVLHGLSIWPIRSTCRGRNPRCQKFRLSGITALCLL